MARTLSEKSIIIMNAIADGQPYSQIVEENHGFTYLDIFNAAREAVDLLSGLSESVYTVEAVRQTYPNAYKPWLKEDDERLMHLVSCGEKVATIAELFGRQPSAIRSRMKKILGPDETDGELIE